MGAIATGGTIVLNPEVLQYARVAKADIEQVAKGEWAALERYWQGAMMLAPPQIMSLAHLSHHARGQDVLDEARQERVLVTAVARQLDAAHMIVDT